MAGDLINVNPNVLNSTIEFLTAMITPALLISATGSLVLSTSTRLGRVVDRVRELEKRLSELIVVEDKDAIPLYEKRLDTIVKLLDKVTTRARILQRAMGAFYYGLGFFILTSVTIAVVVLALGVRDRAKEAHAGVVAEDVDAAEALHGGGDEAFGVLLVAHVGGNERDLPPLGGESPYGLHGLGGVPLGGGDGRALARQPLHDRPADAASGAGHDRDLALEAVAC